MRLLLTVLVLASLTDCSSFRAARALQHVGNPRAAAATPRASAEPAMVFGLRAPSALGAGLPFMPQQQREVLYEGSSAIDFQMEVLHLTKRRVSGGVLVQAPPEAVWSIITDYEGMPDMIPNILSNVVRREKSTGRVMIEQESLLSSRMNLIVSMALEAIEKPQQQKLELRRVSGHGFLEFDAAYTLVPRGDGTTYLRYEVELVPCPIFPLPLVERKIRKEVPKMLHAVGEAARQPRTA